MRFCQRCKKKIEVEFEHEIRPVYSDDEEGKFIGMMLMAGLFAECSCGNHFRISKNAGIGLGDYQSNRFEQGPQIQKDKHIFDQKYAEVKKLLEDWFDKYIWMNIEQLTHGERETANEKRQDANR